MITQAILNSQPKIIREVSVPANTQLVIQEANAARDEAVEAAEVATNAAEQTNQDAQQTASDVIQTTNNKNDAETAKNQAQAAANQTALDVIQTGIDKNDAENSKNLASDYADESVISAEIAAAAGFIFTTTSDGITATNSTTNKYFYVPKTAPDNAFYELYKNVAGVATYVNTYPSSSLITTLQQTADDAGVHSRAAAVSIVQGGTDAEIINSLLTAGGYFNFLNTDNLLSGIVKTDFQLFSSVAYSRASSALALNNSGIYETFLSNVLRKTNKGILLELAATNLVQAPTTLNGTGWSGSGQTLTTGVSTPNAASNGTSVTQTGATDSGRNLAFTPAAAGDYQVSMILKKGEIRYTLITYSGGGYGAVQGLSIDWDASGSPAILTAGIGSSTATSIETLSGGWYRVKFLMKPTTTAAMTLQLRTTTDGTYAGRGSGASAAQIIYNFWHAQIETGTTASSPILTAGTRSADVCAVTWAGNSLSTDTAAITHSGGTVSTIARSAFADSTKLNLIADNAGWLGNYIMSILLTPAQSSAYRSINQRDSDKKVSTFHGLINPIAASIRLALANLGLGSLGQNLGAYDKFLTTDNGSALFLGYDGSNIYCNGEIYGTEAAMLTATGGIRSGNTVTFGGYIDTSVELASIDLATSNGGFVTINGNGSQSYGSGKLTHTGTTNPSGFSRKFEGLSGAALAIISNCRRTGPGSIQLQFSRVGSTMSSGEITDIPTTLGDVTVFGSPNSAAAWWIGARQGGGTPTTAEFTNFRVYKAAPAKGFPNGDFCAYFEGVAPSSLPSTTEVIFQGDINKNNDRFRIELRSAGAVWAVQTSSFGTVNEQNHEVQIGTLTANAAYKLAFGKNRSGIYGGVNGTGAYYDSSLSVGFSHIRIGRSLAGETFSGTITKYYFYAKCEKLLWFKKVTSLSTAPAITKYAKNKIVVCGDSYAEQSSTGIGGMLIDAGFEVINLGAGGTTWAQQYDKIIARPDLYDLTLLWWDGSPNDRPASGNYDDERTKLEAVLTAMGHTRWLYIRNGQIPTGAPGQTTTDMTNFFNYLKNKYGSVHVFDALPTASTFASNDPTNDYYDEDQLALSRGQYPWNAMLANEVAVNSPIHLSVECRIAVINALAGQLMKVCSL